MDPREYGIGAQILRELGIRRMHLLGSQQSAKVVGLKGFGIEIEKVVSTDSSTAANDDYQHENASKNGTLIVDWMSSRPC